jgi:hypothetical protein
MKGVSIETINATQAALEHVGSIASTIDPTNTKNVANSILRMVESIEKMSGVDGSSVDGFVSAISEMAAINTDAVVAKFDGAGPKMVEAGARMMSKFVEGMTSKKVEVSDVASTLCKEFADRMKESDAVLTKEMEALIQSCSDIVTKDPGKIIYNAGAFFVTGFAFGIKENTYIAVARAKEMASAAAKAAAKELDEHSPSKVGYKIGNFFGLAFVNAIGDNVTNAYDIGSKLAKSAKSGLNDSISKIRDIIVGDIDVTPTIRPVLDLSDVRNGAGSIASMLNANASVNANANIGAISGIIRDNNQNGKDPDELISAVRGLRKDIANMPRNSYNINGITYDDGSNVANAVETLIRAAKIEGRV